MENAQLFKGLFQLSLIHSAGSAGAGRFPLFDLHLRPFLERLLSAEQRTATSTPTATGDQERAHALAAEIMAGALRCLKYGGSSLPPSRTERQRLFPFGVTVLC